MEEKLRLRKPDSNARMLFWAPWGLEDIAAVKATASVRLRIAREANLGLRLWRADLDRCSLQSFAMER